jgi:acetyl-CoA carboxylase carboxyl transferase subunit beta
LRDFLRRPGFFPLGQDNRNQENRGPDAKRDFPEDLWTKCPKCNELLYTRELEDNLKVCQKCGYHFRLSSRERIDYLLDPDSFQEEDPEVFAVDPISFTSADERYSDKLVATRQKTGLSDALVFGTGTIEETPAVVAVADFRFMGGSMGSVYGEKIRRAAELAREKKLGLVTVSSSGGARMQEGIFSLMQMAKTSAAAVELSEARLPFISILADPCTGGVTASYATSADVVIGESGALIGFAGPRVIAQTIRQKLPPGFQTAEFQLEHGMLDMVVTRREMRPTVSRLLKMYRNS